MERFSRFIAESVDFHQVDDHEYHFHVGGHKYHVNFYPQDEEESHIEFSRVTSGSTAEIKTTNDMNGLAHHVIGTVKNITYHHLEQNRKIKRVRFWADQSEPSKTKLYSALTAKHANSYQDSEGTGGTWYEIRRPN